MFIPNVDISVTNSRTEGDASLLCIADSNGQQFALEPKRQGTTKHATYRW